jgi:hypothetical protein
MAESHGQEFFCIVRFADRFAELPARWIDVYL